MHISKDDKKATGLSLLLTHSTAQAAPAARWNMFGYNVHHTNFNPNETMLGVANVGAITPVWHFTTGAAIDLSAPAVVNGVAYIGSDDHNVYAVNATTGTEIWHFTTGGAVTTSPAVVKGVVYFGSDAGTFYAVKSTTCAAMLCALRSGSWVHALSTRTGRG